MPVQSSDVKKLGKKLKSKRTPWKPADLRAIKLYSLPAEALDLRKADLMRHSRYSKNGTETVEVRDKQSDPNDITIYKISENPSGSSSNFYDGSIGDDLLQGGAGDDYLQGRDGNDTLTGSAGNDFLDGGNGKNVLTGGDGQDYFRIGLKPSSAPYNDSQHDTITDFNNNQGDKVVIQTISTQQETNTSTRTIQLSSNIDETNRLSRDGAAYIYETFSRRILASPSLIGVSGQMPIAIAILNGSQPATADTFIIAS
jgi:Ca2+-binding RTX toxin-like protein